MAEAADVAAAATVIARRGQDLIRQCKSLSVKTRLSTNRRSMRGSARMSVSDMRSKGNHECEHEQQDQGNAWTRVLAFYVHAKTFLCV